MNKNEKLSFTVQNILNDEDMEDLKVKDLRNFMLHMQKALVDDDDGVVVELEEDLERYIL